MLYTIIFHFFFDTNFQYAIFAYLIQYGGCLPFCWETCKTLFRFNIAPKLFLPFWHANESFAQNLKFKKLRSGLKMRETTHTLTTYFSFTSLGNFKLKFTPNCRQWHQSYYQRRFDMGCTEFLFYGVDNCNKIVLFFSK